MARRTAKPRGDRASSAVDRAPPAGLSRARVCREALALVDEEGLAALSMRRLGARLGVEAMSLYRHVRDKADLLDALHVAVLAELAPADAAPAAGADWRQLLGGMARSLRAAILRHRQLAALFATRPVNAPEAVATIDYARAALRASGFAAAAAEKAVVAVGIFTVGHALAEATAQSPTHARSPRAAGAAEFDFGLEALLDGLQRHCRPPR